MKAQFITWCCYTQSFSHQEVPFKIFAKDEISGQPLTGYTTKIIGNIKINLLQPHQRKSRNAEKIFVNYLGQFEYKRERKAEKNNYSRVVPNGYQIL